MHRWAGDGWVCLWGVLVTLQGCGAGESGSTRGPARVSTAGSNAPAAAAAGAVAPPVQASAMPQPSSSDAPIIRRSEPPANASMQDAVCARDRYQAEQKPLTIYTLFDESGSMLLWWLPVTEAFTAFVRDPQSAGINIALKFFGAECQPQVYSMPHVPIAPLPQNAEPIATQLASRVPLAQTPTTQAVQGARLALERYASTHPDEKTVILLVTDASGGFAESDAEDCYSTVAQAAEVAAQARATNPPIQTFVLGLGDTANLNLLSQAGGTGDALNADPSASATVVAAMREIRRRALPCSYALPPGADKDPKLVNLERVDSAGTAKTIVGVSNAAACDPTAGGWYYDDPRAPTQIHSCPVTCESFAGAAEVNVVLGCPTLTPQ